jgi:hypothetical protein
MLLINPVMDVVYLVENGSSQIAVYQYDSTKGSLTSASSVNLSSPAISGAITSTVTSRASSHNWVVLTDSSGLSSFSIGSDGTLSPASGQTSLAGQPSAILIE